MTVIIPSPGSAICGCDDDAACSYHAGQLYAKEAPNAHVAEPFRDALAELIIERSQHRREIHELAKVRSWESLYEDGIRTYCDDCDEWHGDSHL